MGTYGDVFLSRREKHQDCICWRTNRVIAHTSDMVKASGAAYIRSDYPGIFIEDEIKGRLLNQNRNHVILNMEHTEVLMMLVGKKLEMLLHGAPRKEIRGIVGWGDKFAFQYRARVATLQAAGLFDKILDEVRPQDEWIHQFV